MKCRPGDLAVVIQATHKSNLGRIVRVIRPHDCTGDLVYPIERGHVWLVECAACMTWTKGKKRFRRKKGPLPDAQLQPIRGLPAKRSTSVVISASIKSPAVRITLTNPVSIERITP